MCMEVDVVWGGGGKGIIGHNTDPTCSSHLCLSSFHLHHSIIELQRVLNELWLIIREPIKEGLSKSTCRQWNAMARGFEVANFSTSYFPLCDASCAEVQTVYSQMFPSSSLQLACNQVRT